MHVHLNKWNKGERGRSGVGGGGGFLRVQSVMAGNWIACHRVAMCFHRKTRDLRRPFRRDTRRLIESAKGQEGSHLTFSFRVSHSNWQSGFLPFSFSPSLTRIIVNDKKKPRRRRDFIQNLMHALAERYDLVSGGGSRPGDASFSYVYPPSKCFSITRTDKTRDQPLIRAIKHTYPSIAAPPH